MNRLLQGLCVVCASMALSACPAWSAVPGSDRPVVEQNFNRLIQTNSCPGCDLAGAVLTRVNLAGADLSGANLAGAKLNLADLSGANLSGANLQGASLGGADLANADLTGANLTGAILQGAYLKGAKLDGRITTSPDTGEVGEAVFVADEGKTKHTPYTQEMTIEKRRDFGEQPPAVKESMETAQGESDAHETEQMDSKHPVLMADAVVPDQAVASGAPPASKEPPVLLDETSKQPVATEAASVDTVHQAQGAGVDEDSAVHDMIARIEADAPDSAAQPVQKKSVAPETSSATTSARSAENAPPPPAIAEKKGQPPVPDAQPERAPDEQKADSAIVPAAAATVAAAASRATDTANKLEYTVETPAQAMAKKMLLVEKLLDDEACAECDLAGVDLSGRDLEGADLERANLAGANLAGADLSEANLKGANLSGANLREADLSEADLYKADLSGADLTGADLTDALTDSADFSDAIGVPASVGSP